MDVWDVVEVIVVNSPGISGDSVKSDLRIAARAAILVSLSATVDHP